MTSEEVGFDDHTVILFPSPPEPGDAPIDCHHRREDPVSRTIGVRGIEERVAVAVRDGEFVPRGQQMRDGAIRARRTRRGAPVFAGARDALRQVLTGNLETESRLAERQARPPRKVDELRGPMAAEVATRELAQRFIAIECARLRDPLVEQNERRLAPAPRAKAQDALHREGAENVDPALFCRCDLGLLE